MISHPIWCAIGMATLLLIVRNHWLAYRIQDHLFRVGYWARKTAPTQAVVTELCQLWPARFMLFEIWRWDFDRYIVAQDHLFDMDRFIDEELARTDLDWAAYNQVHPSLIQAALDSALPAAPAPDPAATTPPTDPVVP